MLQLAAKIALVCLAAVAAVPARAAETLHLALLHGDPRVFAYEIDVFRLALAKSGYDAKLEVIPLKTTQARVLADLEHGRGEAEVFFTGFSRDREEKFLQIDIPLTRGLLGHRVFAIRTADQPRFDAIHTLDQLRGMRIGSGFDWPDTDIFRANGFTVVTADYYPLWRMLRSDRFDAFNRGLHEAYIEMTEQGDRDGVPLMVAPGLMVSYRFDYFIYVRKQQRRWYEILRHGLEVAYDDGSFVTHFNSHPAIRPVLDLQERGQWRVFPIDNPLLSPRIRAIPERYWQALPAGRS